MYNRLTKSEASLVWMRRMAGCQGGEEARFYWGFDMWSCRSSGLGRLFTVLGPIRDHEAVLVIHIVISFC